MKAKIKATGEIINIADYATIELDICNSSGNPVMYPVEQIELIQESSDNIDWERERIEISKAVIQGFLSNPANIKAERDNIIKYAIGFANAFIEELKKK